jgi:hypothetical protein
MKNKIVGIVFVFIFFFSGCSFFTDGWYVKYMASGEGSATVEINGESKYVDLPYDEVSYHNVGEIITMGGNTNIMIKYKDSYNHVWSTLGSSNGSEIKKVIKR